VKCRSCKQTLTNPNRRPFEVWCSPTCGIAIWRAKEAKKQAQELRKRKEAMKPRSKWLKEAQAAFNAWIRLRDEGQPCICCRRMHNGRWHAGHYRSTGSAPELRFDERNVWRTCAPCNTHLSGNLLEYRKTLVMMFGHEWVEDLEGPHPPRKYTIQELKAIRDDYKARLKST